MQSSLVILIKDESGELTERDPFSGLGCAQKESSAKGMTMSSSAAPGDLFSIWKMSKLLVIAMKSLALMTC